MAYKKDYKDLIKRALDEAGCPDSYRTVDIERITATERIAGIEKIDTETFLSFLDPEDRERVNICSNCGGIMSYKLDELTGGIICICKRCEDLLDKIHKSPETRR